MTAAAVRAETAGVAIIRTMAAAALTRNRILQLSAAMTIRALESVMSSDKRKSRFPRVIELCGGPARRRVAVLALSAAGAAMNVIGRMTGRTLLWSALVVTAYVAGRARNITVLLPQGIVSLVVIESHSAPRRFGMARTAFRPELTTMRVILFMAAHAARSGLTEFSTRLMTALARQ
jgi:hypothetical protein